MDYGTLYIVGTPIGNLEDMTYRGVRVLSEADIIAAEDTRHSVKLLNHFDIHTKMVAYHKFNERESADKLCAEIKAGKTVALISDAGMPVISDPGYTLVCKCREEGIPVSVVPGPNAALCAVVLSGMDCRQFTFIGFIGKSNKEIKSGVATVIASPVPTVLYESPHRLSKMLALLAESIPERQMSISREITKQYEETLTGTVGEMAAHFETNPPKGEFVLIIAGKDGEAIGETAVYPESITEHVQQYVDRGLTEKEAMKVAAKDRGISRREIYAHLKVRES